MSPAATICIVTKNRREDLRRAVLSALAQEGAAIEVLVIDDGSTDGTAKMIEKDFPGVRLIRNDESRGYVNRRNEAAKLASAPILFSIDDDAEFSDPHIVAKTLKEFDLAEIGAVAIPFVNVLQSQRVMQQAPDSDDIYVTDSYIGTAHALRCDVFRKLGGYRDHLVHQGEEADYCIRLLAAGYFVRLGNASPIHHYESPLRNQRRMDYYGRRNDVLFAVHNVPWQSLVKHIVRTLFNGTRAMIRDAAHPFLMLRGMLDGVIGIFGYWKFRKPVPLPIYHLIRKLKKGGPMLLTRIRKMQLI